MIQLGWGTSCIRPELISHPCSLEPHHFALHPLKGLVFSLSREISQRNRDDHWVGFKFTPAVTTWSPGPRSPGGVPCDLNVSMYDSDSFYF